MSAFRFLPLCAAALVALAPLAAQAQQRHVSPPPLRVSPDLSAPWVMQLQRAPVGARVGQRAGRHLNRDARMTVAPAPAPRRQRAAEPDRQVRTAAVAAGAARQRVELDPKFLPQTVDYAGPHAAGTIVIDTTANFLYLVQPGGKARRYGVGTGKPGFEWAGTHRVSRKREWPDWRPPAAMIKREAAKGHHLPAHMAGGPDNPLGARALYLGSTLYRIHGTNQPWTIGRSVSSGCIRMRNQDVIELYERVGVGTKVVVI